MSVGLPRRSLARSAAGYSVPSNYDEWLLNVKSLLEQVIPLTSSHRKLIDEIASSGHAQTYTKARLSVLRAMRKDFELGFLGENLAAQIEAAIASDYLGQAERLLTEGQPGKYDHVPAAVLAGAVLEKALRTLCDNQQPPLLTIDNHGKPLMLNRLIPDLKKAGVYNEPMAKQLLAWADIRNKAAHGEFDQFTREQVGLMVQGIGHFLAQHMF
ncbi:MULTISPECIES: DUF4145 domain-containing protein [Cyanophyceae]|uniref:DUF4145 domain-containing protein n=1 Tax=Stenomitos frigidus AS-A4 TaxID=2933935 RepID=A0ABV0KSL1_9CYAN|nr:DUF4145 domain-containing protein [Phormidium sp. FACHB-592]